MKAQHIVDKIHSTTTIYEIKLREHLDKRNIQYHTRSCLYGYYPDLIIAGLLFIIEVDGEYHKTSVKQIKHDKKRDKILKSKGYYILRFDNAEIETDIDCVCNKIIDTMKTLSKSPKHRIDYKHNLHIIPI